MCTGPTHATGGLAAGLYAASVYGDITGHPVSGGVAFIAGLLAAGGALLNDLDSHKSTASSAVGPVTAVIGRGVRGLSRVAFALTATHADHAHTKGTHRGLTHTAAFVPAIGFGVFELCDWLGTPGILGTLFAVLFLALRGLPPVNRNLTDLVVAAAGTGLAWLILPSATSGVLIGGAVAVGVLSHSLLDGLTDRGVPLFWPIPLSGQRWRKVGIPLFSTSSAREQLLFWAVATVVTVQLIHLTPGGREEIDAFYAAVNK